MRVEEPPVRILLVDDQQNNLVALESILADIGMMVKADSGRKALRHLLDQDFAVILLDVMMPELDGFETAALIRERDRSRDTPIIFLTALSRSETNVFRGYELGAVDYIFKPFNADILRSKVQVFVELFRKREAIKRQAQELARLNRQTDLILSAAADGVVGVDLEGRTTFANPAALRALRRTLPELRANDLHALVHPTFPGVMTCDPTQCLFRSAVRGELAREDVEETFFREDGRSFPAEFSVSPIHDENQKSIGAVLIFRDVATKRSAAQAAEAERRYHEAESQNRAKDNFLATLSHELRTPMTSILGWVQFLRGGAYSEEELAEALETIENSAKLQARLIDDMLDVSRIVLGKFQIDLRPTRIADVVDRAITLARPAAAERDIQLHVRIDERDALVDADPNRVQQVIGNILANAIKFSRQGDRVDLEMDRDGSRIRIAVTDRGEGIEPAFLPYVFERLRQGEAGSKRSGLGLGLAIARHIIELHHGEIVAESDGRGKGARFVVLIPVTTSTTDTPAKPAIAGARA